MGVNPGKVPDYTERMLAAVERVPGIRAAGAVYAPLPLSGSMMNKIVTVRGRPFSGPGVGLEHRVATPGYLRVLGVPLLRGRELGDGDRAETQPVILINETAARRYWPNEEALRQRLLLDGEAAERVVVGVIADIRSFGPEEPVRPEGYVPPAQSRSPFVTLVMRTSGDPLKALPAVKAAIWGVNKNERLSSTIFTLEQYIALGIRAALGAEPRHLVALVLRRAALVAAGGVTAGLAAAPAASRLLRSFLFGIEATDLTTCIVVAVILGTLTLLAGYVPARTASRPDVACVLRSE